MPSAVSALKAVLQLERSHVGGMSFSVGLDQIEHRIDRRYACEGSGGDGGGNSAAGSDGKEATSVRIDRHVCGWRAKHAISLGHLDWRPFLARVRAGAEVARFPSACLYVIIAPWANQVMIT
jgi:hypothetical protein